MRIVTPPAFGSQLVGPTFSMGSKVDRWDGEHCFLCDRELTEPTKYAEDVFPQWLQKLHELRDDAVILRSKTPLRYRQIVIACCPNCNRTVLSKLENRVRSAFLRGIEGILAADPTDIWLWLAKLCYGLTFRESVLPDYPGASPPQLKQRYMNAYSMLHRLLQALITRVSATPFPGSIYIFKCQTCDKARDNFDRYDSADGPSIAIRSGEVGLIGNLLDWGAIAGATWRHFVAVDNVAPLVPIQFRELMAVSKEQAMMLRNPASVRVSYGPNGWRIESTFDGHPQFDSPNMERFAASLARFTGQQANVIGFPITFLANGQPFAPVRWLARGEVKRSQSSGSH
jgi:hypothetical protein